MPVNEFQATAQVEHDWIDWSALGDQLAANAVLLQRLAAVFSRQELLIDQLEQALSIHDLPEIRRLVHGLKGCAGQIGAVPMVAALQAIEQTQTDAQKADLVPLREAYHGAHQALALRAAQADHAIGRSEEAQPQRPSLFDLRESLLRHRAIPSRDIAALRRHFASDPQAGPAMRMLDAIDELDYSHALEHLQHLIDEGQPEG